MTIMLLTDSCCDLPLSYVKDHQSFIEIIGMPINIGSDNFVDDLGASNYIHTEFYNQLRSGIMPKTAQITPIEFYNVFKRNYLNHTSTIYLGFSSGLSGTYNNAVLAKQMILEEYNDAQIDLIDTLSASVGQGILSVHAVEMIKRQESQADIVKWIENNKLNTHHWFAVTDLMYLKNGGRIPASIAAIGSLLNVKPILTVNNQGLLHSFSKVRGRKKSLNYLITKTKESISNTFDPVIIIGHGNCLEEAEILKKAILSDIPDGNVMISEISATIATHVGPDMIAIGFIGDLRK